MAYIIACLMAALSFLINKALVKYIGIEVLISYSPAVEEASKTLLAYYLGADILVTHITFGILEAGYDYVTSPEHGRLAAVLSIGGHSLFGLLTIGGYSLMGSIWFGLLVVILTHMVWNMTIIRKYAVKEGEDK